MRYRVTFELDSNMKRKDIRQALLKSFEADIFVPSACGELVFLAVEDIERETLFENAIFGKTTRRIKDA